MPPPSPPPKRKKPFSFKPAIAKKSWTRTTYFEERQRKLTEQAPAASSAVLHGVTVYFTGVRSVSQRRLEGLVWRNGGVVQKVWLRRQVTHVIADNLAASKVEKELGGRERSAEVVRPEWLLKSLEEGKKLPTWRFRVVKTAPGLRDVASYFGRKGKKPAKDEEERVSPLSPHSS